MAGGQIPVKVFYLEGGVEKEIRKFTLEQDASTSYDYLLARIKTFFSSLLRKDLEIFWKDEEGDYILVSSDAELMEVMKDVTKVDGQHLKLFIRVKSEASVPLNNQHRGVVCDQCDVSINGIRYKCTVCPDYDLCSTCESKNNHPMEHNLLCIKKPGSVRVACGPWMMGGPRMRCGFNKRFNKRTGECRNGGPGKPKSTKSNENEKTDQPCARHINETVKEFAPMFGLDGDVAASQVQSFFQQFSQQMCPENAERKDDDAATKTTQGESEKKETGSEDEPTPNETGDDAVPKEDSAATDAPAPPTNNFAAAFQPMFNQFGAIPADQFENIGKMMETVFQSFGSAGACNVATNEADQSNVENKKHESDGFLVVEGKTKKDELTEEELFQIRLDETLRQMEGMGFDNDGDWLKQLLVAKNLDISRVLDAMKSSR